MAGRGKVQRAGSGGWGRWRRGRNRGKDGDKGNWPMAPTETREDSTSIRKEESLVLMLGQ